MGSLIDKFPEKGLPEEEVLSLMEERKREDADYKRGKVFSLVYYIDNRHSKFLIKAYEKFASQNLLNPLAFRSLFRFEKEVVKMVGDLFNGDKNVVGVITSGGTESIILAVKTYRDKAREERKIKKPNIVLPITAHVAFLKACEFLCVKPKFVEIDKDFRVNVKKVKKAIDKNTIAVVGSAPSYPYGIVDPIEELGEICEKKGVPLHVDACLGGFMLPFVEKLGYDVPKWDFRVKGVTSISADLHKYGYTSKGASLILYRNIDILQYQFSIFESWVGGIYISPTILGTRPGGPIASAWATLMKMGKSGYLKIAKEVMKTTEKLIEGVEKIPDLMVLGKPHMSVFAYTSKNPDVNIFAVAEQLEKKGWHLNKQQNPEAINHIVTYPHRKVVEKYIEDLKEAVDYVKKHPELAHEGQAAMYGLSAKIPLRGMVKKNILKFYKKLYEEDEIKDVLEEEQTKEDLTTKIGKLYLQLMDRLKKEVSERIQKLR